MTCDTAFVTDYHCSPVPHESEPLDVPLVLAVYQIMDSTRKVRTFFGNSYILAGPHSFKGLFEG